MTWILAAAAVICAVVLLRRRNSSPRNGGFEAVAPPEAVSRAEGPAGGTALTGAEMEEMNREARERRQSAVTARWWHC